VRMERRACHCGLLCHRDSLQAEGMEAIKRAREISIISGLTSFCLSPFSLIIVLSQASLPVLFHSVSYIPPSSIHITFNSLHQPTCASQSSQPSSSLWRQPY